MPAPNSFWNLSSLTFCVYLLSVLLQHQAPDRAYPALTWFEHSLLAFIRGTDLLRLEENGLGHLVGVGASNNFWAQKIREHFATNPGMAWLKLAWRQYLSWFGKTELAVSTADPLPIVQGWLKSAEDNWRVLEDAGVLMDEPRNDGSWIRSWRQAAIKFKKDIS